MRLASITWSSVRVKLWVPAATARLGLLSNPVQVTHVTGDVITLPTSLGGYHSIVATMTTLCPLVKYANTDEKNGDRLLLFTWVSEGERGLNE